MNNQGWVKLHRRILDNPIHLKGEWFSIWIHLLLLASHDEHSFIWNGKSEVIKSGQLVTGRKELAKQCGVSESMVERVLKYLEIEHQIEQQKTTKYRVITILNWDKYQTEDSKSDNKRTTDEQQADTYKNDNNVKNVRKSSRVASLPGVTTFKSPADEINQVIDSFKGVNPNYMNFFKRTAERMAASDLIQSYGLSKVLETTDVLPQVITKPYAPRITSPSQLREGYAKLAAFVVQEQTRRTELKTKQRIVLS